MPNMGRKDRGATKTKHTVQKITIYGVESEQQMYWNPRGSAEQEALLTESVKNERAKKAHDILGYRGKIVKIIGQRQTDFPEEWERKNPVRIVEIGQNMARAASQKLSVSRDTIRSGKMI